MGHTNDRSTKASSLVNPTSLNLQPRPFAPLESDEKEEAVSRKSGYSENFLEKIINTPSSESATPVQRKSGNRLKAIAAERANAALQNQSIQRQEAVEKEKNEGGQGDGQEFTMNPEPPPVQRKFENRLRAKNAQRMEIQAKLAIGEPNDKYEQEADATAARVVQQINSSTTSQSQPVQRQGMEEDEELQMKPIVQRRENIGGGEASADLESSIQSARGGGQSLDANLQQSMGQAMGADFSGVKVHTDSQSDQLNKSIQAKAFTTGQDVFFRQGAYEPGSRGGQELIAHELTHVVQQTGAVQRSQSQAIFHDFSHVDLFSHDPDPRSTPNLLQLRVTQPKLTVGAANDQYALQRRPLAEQIQQVKIPTEWEEQESLSKNKKSEIVSKDTSGQIRRVSNTGIASPDSEEAVGKMAEYAWSAPESKGWNLENYLRQLFDLQNDELEHNVPGCPKLNYESIATGSDYGSFDRKTWTVKIRTKITRTEKSGKKDITTVDDLTAAELGEIVDTIHHEVRHAEQWYRVAQKHIRDELNTERNKNWESLKALTDDLSQRVTGLTSLPPFVVKAAVKAVVNATAEKAVPRDGTVQETEDDWGSRLKDNYNWSTSEDEGSRKETEEWASILTGAWSTYNAEVKWMQDQVYPEMTNLQAAWPVTIGSKRFVVKDGTMENASFKDISSIEPIIIKLKEEMVRGQEAVDKAVATDQSSKGQKYQADWQNIGEMHSKMRTAWATYKSAIATKEYNEKYKSIRDKGALGYKSRPDDLDTIGTAWADAMENFRKALYRAYVNAAHEEDAHAVGARVKQTVLNAAAERNSQ